MKQKFFIIALLIVFLFSLVKTVSAANVSAGVAILIELNDKSIQPADIISFDDKGYIRTKVAYDPSVFGVVVASPAAAFDDQSASNSKFVLSSGKVYLHVSSINGPIKQNDLLTSSTVAGAAQKATKDGYVVATALEDYSSNDPKKVGTILVVLNLGFHSQPTSLRSNLFQNLNLAFAAPFLTPVNSLRYIIAALITILSLLIAIFFFGRVSRKGIESLGRNPLASKVIMFSIAVNFALALATIAFGVAISYLILIL